MVVFYYIKVFVILFIFFLGTNRYSLY